MSITLSSGRNQARSGSLLYDQDCGLCVATAAWLARRVPSSRLDLLPLGDAGADPRIGPLVEGRNLAATIHFVRSDGAVLTGARAALAAGRLVPRWRFAAMLFDNRAGHALLEPLYRQIASHRRQVGRLLGLPASCPIPTGRERPAG
jgi:predicted DCC family thiol-disulfide oxidoreductase YuxK